MSGSSKKMHKEKPALKRGRELRYSGVALKFYSEDEGLTVKVEAGLVRVGQLPEVHGA
jgi:hypothetical protein